MGGQLTRQPTEDTMPERDEEVTELKLAMDRTRWWREHR